MIPASEDTIGIGTSTTAPLVVRGLRTRAVLVPMKRPLRTSVASVTRAPLVLIDLQTEEGVTGRAYLFAYVESISLILKRLLDSFLPSIIGAPVEPATIGRRAGDAFRLLGAEGIVGMCLAGLDVACWDVMAKAARLPLARLLGGSPEQIQAYNSNGLGIVGPDEAADEALALLDAGFGALKVRLGRQSFTDDLAVVRAIRRAIPNDAMLMADFNQSLSATEAIRRGRQLDGEGLYWIEEPTAHDDYSGHAAIARAIQTPIQIGENFSSPRDMQAALNAGACHFAMPDVERIGGVTGWLQAAAVAEIARMPMSSHLFPEISCHLLSVTPTRHWLEYVDWADAILQEPLTVSRGYVRTPDRFGNGISWDEEAVEYYSQR